MRFHTFPRWLKRFYPGAIWDLEGPGKTIYLTFDDGPHPLTTPWLLDVLDQYQAKATFFCLGKNVADHPALFEEIIRRGHSVGNHGMHHLKGFETPCETYLDDVHAAQKYIPGNLFRPAYGKITRGQFKAIKQLGYRVVFWSVMPYDFDAAFDPGKRLNITRKKTAPGSILVFHDSEKAFPQLKPELPKLLEEWKASGYRFEKIKQKQ
jgi:peptidoglycan-N-acetylglucosamine deacetylase